MKHVFIINPTAGKRNCTTELMEMAKALQARHGLDLDCILTKRPGHATETARSIAAAGRHRPLLCLRWRRHRQRGGQRHRGHGKRRHDLHPRGHRQRLPQKLRGRGPLFSDAENLWDGPQFPLDAIDCNGRLAMTIACSGFDAQVAEDVHRFGKSPLLGGQGSYIASLAVNFLIRGLSHRWTVTLDGAGKCPGTTP